MWSPARPAGERVGHRGDLFKSPKSKLLVRFGLLVTPDMLNIQNPLRLMRFWMPVMPGGGGLEAQRSLKNGSNEGARVWMAARAFTDLDSHRAKIRIGLRPTSAPDATLRCLNAGQQQCPPLTGRTTSSYATAS